MRAAKERRRLEGAAPDYPAALPHLRRQVIIIDYDQGMDVHMLNLYRSDRIDCYKVTADGEPWRERIGWARILEGLRKSMPRVMLPRCV